MARVVALEVADDPDAWRDAGFRVDDADDGGATVRIGDLTIALVGRSEDRSGIVAWTLAGVGETAPDLDGLPTTFVPGDPGDLLGFRPAALGWDRPADTAGATGGVVGGDNATEDPQPAADPTTQPETDAAPPHPNGVIGVDHVVVASPDLERTIAALEARQVPCRRIRDTTGPDGNPMRQAFFRFGPIIVEVVSGATPSGESAAVAPARWFGLAVDAEDLDRTRAVLGDGISEARAAVQPGRRIATLRGRSFDVSVPIAVMDDHAGRLP